MNTKKVVTLIKSDIGGNYKVSNWVAECKKEAIQIVETKIKEIREEWKDSIDKHNRVHTDEHLTLTKEWVSEDNCHLYFGDGKPSMDDWLESGLQFNFFITDSEN